MPLQPQTISVPIRPANQQAPTTSAPAGRIKSMINKVATKNEGGPVGPNDPPDSGERLTVGARNGMQSLPLEVRNVTTGELVSSTVGVPGANLVSSLGTELVAVAGSTPYVLSENSASWSKYPYIYSPVTARTRPVVADNIQIANPEGATIGGKIFRVWSQPKAVNSNIVGVQGMVIDVDGTVIRAPFNLVAGFADARAKAVSDGTRFWVVFSVNTTVVIRAYDTHGVQIGAEVALTSELATSHDSWDLTYVGGYVLLAKVTSTVANVRKITISGTTISSTNYTLSGNARGSYGVGWAENADADGNAYLLTAYNDDGQIQEYAFRIGTLSTTPTVTGYFSVVQSSGEGMIYALDGEGHTAVGNGYGYCCELTGVYRGGVLYAQVSFMEYPTDTVGDIRADRIVPVTGTVGALATAGATVRGVKAASRTFVHDGRDVLLAYYPDSGTAVVGESPDQVSYSGEPTYFLLDVLTMQVCGRFSPGIAGMEWMRQSFAGATTGPFQFCVSHVFIDNISITHVPCGFQSRQFSDTTVTLIQARSGPTAFSPTKLVKSSLVSAIGYQDILLGGVGQAIETGEELMMPGAIATVFDGATFSEAGINLAPAQPAAVASTGGSVEIGRREYVVVFQSVERNGDRVFSAPSTPVVITTTGTDRTITLTGRTLRMTTRTNITIAVYRNVIVAGVPSTVHYRVDDPLVPLYNNIAAEEWTFADTASDDTISAHERLYTDDDLRPRDPMPGFSTADIFDGRVVCDSQDGSVWFSAQKVEGDATWFTASQRIPAVTAEPLKNIVAMDSRLVEIYDKHIWLQEAAGMPGPTNSSVGSIRAAEKATFTNGGTGHARLVNEGVMYSSSEGGVWLVTRGLINQRVTGPVVDDIAGLAVTGIVVDASQRVHIGATSTDAVFDQLSGCWSRFDTPFAPTVVHLLRGLILFADSVGIVAEAPQFHRDYAHNGSQAYITGPLEFKPFHFGGVKNFNRLWRFNVQGRTMYRHTVTMTAVYDTDTSGTVTESWTWAVEPGDKWAFEFQPKLEQMENLTLSFIESFPGALTYDGQSFEIEMLGFEMGVEQGLARVPLAKRIQST